MHRFIPLAVLLTTAALGSAQEPSKSEKADGFVSLFNGKDLSGWEPAPEWAVNDAGTLICKKAAKEPRFRTLRTKKEYTDFVLRLDYLLTADCNNGIGLRIDPKHGDTIGDANKVLEVQLVDEKYILRKDPNLPNKKKDPKGYTPGAVHGIKEARTWAQKKAEEWNSIEIVAKGPHIRVILNGQEIVNCQLDAKSTFRSQNRTSGQIGLCGFVGQAEFKNIRIKELTK